MPPVSEMAPTMGGNVNVLVFSAVICRGPISMTFSLVVYVIPWYPKAAIPKTIRITARIVVVLIWSSFLLDQFIKSVIAAIPPLHRPEPVLAKQGVDKADGSGGLMTVDAIRILRVPDRYDVHEA